MRQATHRIMDGFISYAHDDYKIMLELLKHLAPMERKLGLNFWHDSAINAGDHWSTEIQEAIDRAHVFVLLATPSFLASDFIHRMEIPTIKRRLRACRGKVVPVLVRACAWEFELGAMQAVPIHDGRARPIEDWRPRNNGYNMARDQIDSAISLHFGIRPQRRRWPLRKT